MKMKKEHFESLATAINKIINKHGKTVLIDAYENGQFNNAEKTKDLNQRFRWDLLWASGFNLNLIYKDYDFLYDSHIDTALKKIVNFKLTRKF